MKIRRFADETTLAHAAAAHAGDAIRQAMAAKKTARILVATDNSLGSSRAALARVTGITWGEVELFQLCEYLGLPAEHPATVRSTLFAELINSTRLGRYHLLDGQHEPERSCREAGRQLAAEPADVALIGLGENGRLIFNAPPADLATESPYLIVRLDAAARPAAAERWFSSPADVPQRGITISIRQLLKAKTIVCVVPGARKADAVKRALEGAVSPLAPASILRTHPDVTWYLDAASAALLSDGGESSRH